MLVVSKQRVMRHKLSTDVNMSFSDILVHTIIYKAQKISFIYTYHLYINIALSYEILFVSSCGWWYLYMLLPS